MPCPHEDLISLLLCFIQCFFCVCVCVWNCLTHLDSVCQWSQCTIKRWFLLFHLLTVIVSASHTTSIGLFHGPNLWNSTSLNVSTASDHVGIPVAVAHMAVYLNANNVIVIPKPHECTWHLGLCWESVSHKQKQLYIDFWRIWVVVYFFLSLKPEFPIPSFSQCIIIFRTAESGYHRSVDAILQHTETAIYAA